jgi:hypothetical protein
MTLGSLTQHKELEGDPGGGGTTPFPWDEEIMKAYDGHPPPGTPTHCG